MPEKHCFLTLIILTLVITACKSPSRVNGKDDHNNRAKMEIDHTPMILLVNGEIFSVDSVVIIDATLSPGTLRERNKHQGDTTPSDMLITFMNNNFEKCMQIGIDNPLVRRVEFSNNHQSLQTQTIELERAHFFARVQYTSCMQQIMVQKVTQPGLKTLLIHPLPLP